MHSFVLQDFTTIRGAFGVTVTQSENAWHDMEHYEDLIAWIDVREVTFSTGSTAITLNLQTAPIKDEYLFVSMATGLSVTAALTAPNIQKIIMSQNPTVPLGRFLRWQLVPSGGTAGPWDMTFRILCCANSVGGGGGGRGMPASPFGR